MDVDDDGTSNIEQIEYGFDDESFIDYNRLNYFSHYGDSNRKMFFLIIV